MFPNKYVELSLSKSGQPDQRHVIMFRESLQHRQALEIIYEYIKDHDLAVDVKSAGSIRLNKDGYCSYGSSLSLNYGHDVKIGSYLSKKLLEQGFDYLVKNREVILVTQGLIDKDKAEVQPGSLYATEDRSSPSVKLVYRIQSVSGWFGGEGVSERLLNNLERILNCGNLDF